MNLGYKNSQIHKFTKVHFLKIRKIGELWISIKNVGNGLGVKNISDLVLKEIYGIYGGKNQQKEKLNATK